MKNYMNKIRIGGKEMDEETKKELKRYNKKWFIISVIVIAISTILIIIGSLPEYKCSIVKFDVHSDTSASICYKVENYTNEDKAYMVYAYIEKDGETLAKGMNYIFVNANSTNQWSILLKTDRNVSFYGSTARISVHDLGMKRIN